MRLWSRRFNTGKIYELGKKKKIISVTVVLRIFWFFSSDARLRYRYFTYELLASCHQKYSGFDPTAFRYCTASFLSTLSSATLGMMSFRYCTTVLLYTGEDASRLRLMDSVAGLCGIRSCADKLGGGWERDEQRTAKRYDDDGDGKDVGF